MLGFRRGQAAILNRMVRGGVMEKVINEDSQNEEIKPVDIWRRVFQTERTSAKVLGQECLGYCRNSKGAMWRGWGERRLQEIKSEQSRDWLASGSQTTARTWAFLPQMGPLEGSEQRQGGARSDSHSDGITLADVL